MSDWDVSSNDPNIVANEIWRQRTEEYDSRRRIREAESFDPPEIDIHEIRRSFGFSSQFSDSQITVYNRWRTNRVVYICHNCGSFGYKLGRTSPLFKCYSCRSRNLTVIRAGELSLAIRNQEIGINMEDVFRERQETQRRARAARAR